MRLSEVIIILCQVSEAGNAGAVCRAMKNMGLSQLRLAAPHPLILEKIYERAVNSWDIWENARIFDSLKEATADCSIVIGTTRRRGHRRKSVSMPPRDLALWLKDRPGPAAIVFGNERTGLEEPELELCNFASHIPVSENCPSLNLSHAVQLYAYELFLAMGLPTSPDGRSFKVEQRHVKGEWTAMNQAQITGLVGSITNSLAELGFYKKPNRQMQSQFLQDVIARAGLAEREGRYLEEIITKAGWLGASNK